MHFCVNNCIQQTAFLSICLQKISLTTFCFMIKGKKLLTFANDFAKFVEDPPSKKRVGWILCWFIKSFCHAGELATLISEVSYHGIFPTLLFHISFCLINSRKCWRFQTTDMWTAFLKRCLQTLFFAPLRSFSQN